MEKILQGKALVYTTNYFNTFIQVAEDSAVTKAVTPPLKVKKGATEASPETAGQTQGRIQYELIQGHPYHYNSDEVLFSVYALQHGLAKSEWSKSRLAFFKKPKACFRASVLCKKFGWGVHFNREGKMALYAVGSAKYRQLSEDPDIKQLKAMRSARKGKA